jgi:ubiquinone/menaquinone biosynthesis C-methylase UbiE
MDNALRDNPELAESYDRISHGQFKLGCILAERMGIKNGDQLLDVGCGTGQLSLHLSKIVGASGSVIGLDPSPHRINIANGKLGDWTPHNVRFQIGHAEDLGVFSEGIFDGICYSSVFHWIDDKRAALTEAHRVLKNGGKVGITTLNKDEPSSFRTIIAKVLKEQNYLRQSRNKEGSSRPIAAEELYDSLAEAGFSRITIERYSMKRHYSDPEDALKFYEASSFGNLLRSVPDDLREKIRVDLELEMEKRRTEKGIELLSNVILAIAEKEAQG